MDKSISEISAFYKDKVIFITGASGFMGKVLLEKLLYRCSDLDKIYILLRAKKGRSFENRLEDMFKLPMFQRIRDEKPEVFKKVIPLQGDLSLENLGLNEEYYELLINEVNLVYHFAATLRLEATLRNAVEMNLIGTRSMLELAKQMKYLEFFVHLSTAFCHVDQEELGERIYDSVDNPDDIIRLVQWLNEDVINLITPKLIHPHPNTYTYTKRLGETLVAREYPNMPCCIVRPAIVTSSYSEPLVGWVDNLNGPTGLMVGAGKGVIRSMHCKAEYNAEVMPVDMTINAVIAITYKIVENPKKSKSIPVYNITQSGVLPLTWSEILERGRKIIYEYPFEGQIWYPDGNMRGSKFVHNLFVFFFHIIPAYLIDFLMIIFQQKTFMVRLQKRISIGLEYLQFFTTRRWKFHSNKLFSLQKSLSPVDKELFKVIFHDINLDEYIKNYILGSRQYCMKEDLSTLPRARRHQKMMYVIHILAVYLFYFGILYLLYNQFETIKFCLDYGIDKVKSLPINFMAKTHEKEL